MIYNNNITMSTPRPDTPRPDVSQSNTTIIKKTPEKQKQENGQKPSPSHCKKNGLFQNHDTPPDGGCDQEVC